MPEIVEVKKYVEFINKYVINKKLTDINIINGRYKKHKKFELYNLIKKNLPIKLINICSKGKLIYFEFLLNNNNNYYLINTLGLSGGWAFKPNNNKKYIIPRLLKYTDKKKINNYLLRSLNNINIEFKFTNGILYFFDMLSFGTIKFLDNYNDLEKKLNSIGPDIMDINTTLNIFVKRLIKYSNKKIGIVLLNQKVISGIGNYLRAESLWLAKINPFKLIKDLTKIEFIKLFKSLKIITWGLFNKKKGIKLNILKKNTKISYDYNRDFYIYRQEKDIYNNNIIKEELYEGSQKRYIYWCPQIQT